MGRHRAGHRLARRASRQLGIIANGVAARHAREAAPEASLLELKLVHPLPLEKIRAFAASVERCVVLEEGDPVIADAMRAAGIAGRGEARAFRFGELDVPRVRRILAHDLSPEPEAAARASRRSSARPARTTRSTRSLRKLDCIVAGDIGCYTLGVLPPYEGMDTCVAMGASLGVGLGLRHVLPEADARKVVSIIGDSTFVHTGLNGLVEMVYNPPPTGHVLIVLDNGTTAMTGQQEHPGTGRTLDHAPTGKLSIEGLARALGVANVDVVDPIADPGRLRAAPRGPARRRPSSPSSSRAARASSPRRTSASTRRPRPIGACAACPEAENV